MTDKPPRDRLKDLLHSDRKPKPAPHEPEFEGVVANCEAFGYFRGLRDASASIEFRFRTGNSVFFSYGLLASWQYNPSEGILLKFVSDTVSLVLIRGSNLDKPLGDGCINLTNAGLQRHRILWVREMTTEEIDRIGVSGPTIDSISVGEFTSHQERLEWVKKESPAFLAQVEG